MTKKQKNRNLRGEKSTRHIRKSQRGQILIIVVFAIVGLVAFVGLVVDTGLVFIGNGKLRRAVDAAALAAAAQYRKDPNPNALSADALEFLTLNGIDNGTAIVKVCNITYPYFNEDDLCTSPALRRLVKVYATSTVNLAFLPVLGIRTVTLSANATSEAASLDIVLAMDVSESMTWDQPLYSLMRDPAECNNVPSATDYTNCEPFSHIQQAAVAFVEDLFPSDGSNEYDRVAIIPFDRNAHSTVTGNYNDPLPLAAQSSYSSTAYRQKIIDTIKGLRVFDADGAAATGHYNTSGSCLDGSGNISYPTDAPCRYYPPNETIDTPYCFDSSGTPISLTYTPPTEATFLDNRCLTATPAGSPYIGPYVDTFAGANYGEHFTRPFINFACPRLGPDQPEIYSKCGTTNTGGAFNAAGAEFVIPASFRQQSLWVVIMLTDGNANHSDADQYCPDSDGPQCQDSSVKTVDSGTRHCLFAGDILYHDNTFLHTTCVTAPPDGGGGVDDPTAYDADDYARDMADFVALGQSALIYTIGFGDALDHGNPNSSGEQLLNYAADIGDDGKIDTPATTLNSDYFYAHDATALAKIFQTISQRIATRLTQ